MTNKLLDLCYSRCTLANDYEQSLEQYERRLLLGSFAQAIDRSIHNGRWTHQFRVYIKAIKEGDVAKAAADLPDSYEPLADYAVKVVFRFNDNCSNGIHMVESPPYESGAYCNNDTKVTVTILFKDTSHTCTIFHHYVTMALDPDSPSIQETVRSIFFVNPSDTMKMMLKLPVEPEPEMFDALEGPPIDDVEVQEPNVEQPEEESENDPDEDTSLYEQSQEDNNSEYESGDSQNGYQDAEEDSPNGSQDAEEDSSDYFDNLSQGSHQNEPPNEPQDEAQNDLMEDPQEEPDDEPQEESESDSELEDVWKETIDYYTENGVIFEVLSGDRLETIEEEQEAEAEAEAEAQAEAEAEAQAEAEAEAQAQAMYEQEKEDAGQDAAPLEEKKIELTEEELEIQRQQDELNEDLERARESLNVERRYIVNPGPRDA